MSEEVPSSGPSSSAPDPTQAPAQIPMHVIQVQVPANMPEGMVRTALALGMMVMTKCQHEGKAIIAIPGMIPSNPKPTVIISEVMCRSKDDYDNLIKAGQKITKANMMDAKAAISNSIDALALKVGADKLRNNVKNNQPSKIILPGQ